MDGPKIVSPSITVCDGVVARARPSWPIVGQPGGARFVERGRPWRRRRASSPCRAPAGRVGRRAKGRNRAGLASTSGRNPCGRPETGSTTEPTALSTTSAATVAPLSSTALAVPTPPLRPPTTAPGARADDALARTARRSRRRRRRRPSPRSGGAPNAPPRPRSNTTAAGTIGTTPPGTGKPDARRLQSGHHAVGGGEPVRRPAGQHDGVDALDGRVRAEQVGLAGTGRRPAHVGARHGAPDGRSTTVVPERPPSTCACPTRRPTTSVRALCGPCGMRSSWAADARAGRPTRRRGDATPTDPGRETSLRRDAGLTAGNADSPRRNARLTASRRTTHRDGMPTRRDETYDSP